MTDQTNPGRLIPCVCVLVENIEVVIEFFTKSFECTVSKPFSRPVRYSTIRLAVGEKIVLVQRASCSPSQLEYFEAASVRHIFVAVKDAGLSKTLSIQAGGKVRGSDSLFVVEGPEGIVFHVVSNEKLENNFTDELVISSINSEHEKSSLSPSTPNGSKHKSRGPRGLPPAIPTLDVSILSNNSKMFIPCPPNCPIGGVPFETEFFKGIANLLIRTTPPCEDDNIKSFFEGRRRMFEVQVQGKFKRLPAGEIYVGAEAANKMELGLITRSISKAACNFCATMVNDLHYSFGDDQSKPNFQVPHIVAPLFPTLDKIIVTPAGETPPDVGLPFVEDPAFRKERLKWRSCQGHIDLDTTYSFSVNTSNMDLSAWTLVNIPMTKPMDLRTFFGDSSIKLVAYELPKSLIDAGVSTHPECSLNYVFNINLTPCDPDKVVDVVGADESETEDEEDPEMDANSDVPPQESLDMANSYDDQGQLAHGEVRAQATSSDADVLDSDMLEDRIKSNSLGDNLEADDSDAESFDEDQPSAGAGSSLFKKKRKPKTTTDGGTVGSWFRRKIDNMTPDALDVPELADYTQPDYPMESFGDLRYCPMALEVNDHRLMREGRRRTIFVLPYLDHHSTTMMVRFRAYSEIIRVMPMIPIPKLHKNKKMSQDERKRRHIVESYMSLLAKLSPNSSTPTHQMLFPLNDLDKNFLASNGAVLQRTRVKGDKAPNDKWEGAVAMAWSSRHWSEQFVRISKSEVQISKSPDAVRVSYTIPHTNIICVRPMRSEETPLHGVTEFAFFQMETFARVFYFMVRDRHLTEWISVFSLFLGEGIVLTDSTSDQREPLPEVEAIEPYVARPLCWKVDKRRLFNCRSIIFNTNGIASTMRKNTPNELCEDMLAKAFELTVAESNGIADAGMWITFLDKITVLQVLEISHLTERERAAFFLNLYHLMVLHASLINGPPQSWASWQAFFNTSYLLSFDIVSILEVEHNLIRGAMSRPSPLLSKIGAPNTNFPGMALTQRDFRLNFCINNSSHSLPATVPIYKVDTLDRVLDEYTSRMLAETVEIDVQRRTVTLPKVCSWFPGDFVPRRGGASVPGTPLDCLRAVASYMRGEERTALIRLLTDGASPTVKFKNFQFRCRLLSEFNQDNGPSRPSNGQILSQLSADE